MNFDNLKPEDLKRQAKLCEEKWAALCDSRGETRFVEMFDRRRMTYGRLFLPSEVMFVWSGQAGWIPGNDNDNFGIWEPIVSQVQR